MIMNDDQDYLIKFENTSAVLVYQIHPQVKSFKRSAYNSLDLLGDVGGLFDGLKLVLTSFLTALSGIDYTSLLISKLFLVGKSVTNLNHNSLNP